MTVRSFEGAKCVGLPHLEMGDSFALRRCAGTGDTYAQETTHASRPRTKGVGAPVQGLRRPIGDDRLMDILTLDPNDPQEVPGISTSRATLPGRLVRRLQRQGDCLVWTGASRQSGYGCISVFENGVVKVIDVHRVAYELTKGPIPDGMWIDHLCRNKLCADPFHLEATAPGENSRRGRYFNLPPTCKNGHEYKPGSYWMRKTGTKTCKQCRREWEAANRGRKG